jgi:hypothetical protein
MCLAIEKMRNETKQAKAETKQEKAKRKKAEDRAVRAEAKVKQAEEKTNRLVAVLKALGKSDSEIDALMNGQCLAAS